MLDYVGMRRCNPLPACWLQAEWWESAHALVVRCAQFHILEPVERGNVAMYNSETMNLNVRSGFCFEQDATSRHLWRLA